MAIDYTLWPTPAQVRARLANLGVTPRDALADDDIQGILNELITEIERDTLRQFLPITEDRYFDGSGTGIMEVDEFVTYNTLQVIGFIGTQGMQLPQIVPVIRQGRPNFRLAIARGSVPSYSRVWLAYFPEGRQNIVINAVWGYGATIPADLWQVVLDGAAVQCSNFTIYNPIGRLASSKLGDKSRSYKLSLPGELIDLDRRIKSCKKRYKSPLAKKFRQAPRMI